MGAFMNKTYKYVSLFFLFLLTTVAFSQTKPDALKLYTQGDYTGAISVCESELITNPNNLDSYCVLCWALVADRQYLQAEQRALAARKISAYDMRIIEVLAEAKYYLGKNVEALSLFQQYIGGVPITGSRVSSAYFYMGEIYIRQKKYQHADISLTTACRMEVKLDYWWTRLGYAREMCKDYSAALSAYDKALSLNPSRQEAITGKTRCSEQVR